MTEQSPAEAIFFAALERGMPEDRAAFLDAACGDDVDLRRRVDRLLAAHPQVGSFLETAAPVSAETAWQPGPADAVGTLIAGRYKLIEAIGEGGMGTVYMAQQIAPVRRVVALKVIKPGMDSKQVLARFEAERQALALMDHPNIARVLDGGLTEQGRPFFAMELVKGVPITRFCDERKLTPRERLELFVPVCRAIQHAHNKGVIHRDIKPSNVLVALYDGVPVAKVIDFGVAKAAGQQLTESTLVTGFGVVIGTPEYMSPEQAELNQLDIDTRSDVYALGVLLYELLTGTTPIDRKRLGKAAVLEILRIVRQDEPPRPSTRLSSSDALPTIAADRRTEPARLAKLLRGELDWIVMKCLEKERRRRYETANGLAQDIRRYLADEAVEAGPPGPGYRLRKFTSRNKGRLAAAALILIALLGGALVSTWQLAERKREQSERRWEQGGVAARAKQAFQLQLDRAEAGLKRHKLDEAGDALRQAELLPIPDDAAGFRDRLATARKDLDMVRRLDEIFEWRWNLHDCRGGLVTDKAQAKDLYPPALREYGLRIGEEPAEQSVAAVQRSTIADTLRLALNQWFFLEHAQPGLRAVLDADDPDPLRRKVRAAVASGQNDRVAELVEVADPGRFSPEFATALGMYLPADKGLRLFKEAWRRHPDSFILAMSIAARLTELDNAIFGGESADSAGWCRIGVALRPESAFAHHYLGVALGGVGDKDGQNAELGEAIRLSPRFARAAIVLAFDFYHMQKRKEDAFALYRSLVEANPDDAAGHAGLCKYYSHKKRWADAGREYLSLLEAMKDPDYNRDHSHDESCFDHSINVVTLNENEAILAGLLSEGDLDGAFHFGEQHIVIWKDVWSHGSCASALFSEQEGGRTPSEGERARVRRKALEWFHRGVARWHELNDKDPTSSSARWSIENWPTDARLAVVRDEEALAKLPEGEREGWKKLWADVKAALDRTTPPEPALKPVNP